MQRRPPEAMSRRDFLRATAATAASASAAVTFPATAQADAGTFDDPGPGDLVEVTIAELQARMSSGHVTARELVRQYRGGCLGAGAAAQQGGGDGADGQGGHDQHGVPGDRGVEADLGLVEPEAVLAELEIFFSRPAQPGGADRPRRR